MEYNIKDTTKNGVCSPKHTRTQRSLPPRRHVFHSPWNTILEEFLLWNENIEPQQTLVKTTHKVINKYRPWEELTKREGNYDRE